MRLPSMIRQWLRLEVANDVDVADPIRKRLIQEAEYQAACDAGSHVLRVSGKCRKPDGIPIKAVIERMAANGID